MRDKYGKFLAPGLNINISTWYRQYFGKITNEISDKIKLVTYKGEGKIRKGVWGVFNCIALQLEVLKCLGLYFTSQLCLVEIL